MAIALVREVTDSFARAVTHRPVVPSLDPETARRQHLSYRHALAAGGFEVRVIEGDEAHPDGCFIEDAAVVIGGIGLVTRPGHPSRRGETGAVSAALSGLVEVVEMSAGSLDGGDVLQMGAVVFVGVGNRTDQAGADALASICARLGRHLIEVPAGGTLHLKSGVSAVDDRTLLWHASAGSREVFSEFRVVEVPGDDPEAANVVRLPDGRVLVAEHHETTAELVRGLGHEVVPCDVSEFGRADGGLTCLSIRLR